MDNLKAWILGISKQNRRQNSGFGKYTRDAGCRKYPSGLRDWGRIWVGKSRLKPIGDPISFGFSYVFLEENISRRICF